MRVLHGRQRIFLVGGGGGGGGATMKRALMENIRKRAQYDLPTPRSDNDGPGGAVRSTRGI